MAALTGEISQVPPGISAIKVGGQRAYRLARAGAAPELAAEDGHGERVRRRRDPAASATCSTSTCGVTCSSGTYIRALARDLGAALGVGGHLTALRRTRVGPYLRRPGAHPGRSWRERLELIPLADGGRGGVRPAGPDRGAGARARPRRPAGRRQAPGTRPVAAFGPDGSLIALLTDDGGRARSLAVFATDSDADPPAGS